VDSVSGTRQTSTAAAAILTPVALAVAATTHLNPVLLLTLIGTCISFTFLNLFSHQSNLMVMKPGGYSSATFMRFGIPLTLVSLATSPKWAGSQSNWVIPRGRCC
jgi:di/tricarboxylate transporter